MNCNAPEHQTTCRILLTTYATALAVAITVALPVGPHRQRYTTTRALQHSSAGGEQGVPCGSCRRHPGLYLLAMSKPEHLHVPQHLRLRLDTVHAASHLI
jgi:hypothetical protein